MIVTNAQNIVVPDYLNKAFFVDALEEGLREVKITVHEVNFEWGSNPGENYCSSIYRVLVTFERYVGRAFTADKEQLSLIVKTIPITPETQFLEDVGVFIKEKVTYTDVLPRLEILGDGAKFGANLYYAVKTPVQTIVFNDLKVDGFSLASRQDGLDWNHSELLLQQLAKFHASSMVLAKKDPAITKRFDKGMLSPETVIDSETFSHMFGGSLAHLVDTSANWPGFEEISAKLQRYHKNFKTITSKLGAPKVNDRFTVLNHGDLWTNNFMFAYDDAADAKRPTRAIFVDFQLSFYGSPACDINFFLNTSVQLDLLQHKREALIATYYETLAKTLKYLRYENVPTLVDLKHEMRNRELYGLFALFGFLPTVTMPKELSADNSLEAMHDEEFKRKKFDKVFANPKLQEHFKWSLKRMDELGVLDEF